MSTSAVFSSDDLRERYSSGMASLRREFDGSGSGSSVASGRSQLVDDVITTCYDRLVTNEIIPPGCVSIVALGGYGRAALLPQSDVDLLFLFKDARHETAYKDSLSRIYLQLWDLEIRASATARTVAECGKLDCDNPEFTVSLLDSRFLIGESGLFEDVRQRVLPSLLNKSGIALIAMVRESARARHAKFANTTYHLEPNVKEGPGGLRDYNLACWLALVERFRETGGWPQEDSLFEQPLRTELKSAFQFFISVRCFLHYRHGRDDNHLSWEAQDAAAERGVGIPESRLAPAQWMRGYFRNARTMYAASLQLLQESEVKPVSFIERLKSWGAEKVERGLGEGIVRLPEERVPGIAYALQLFERLAHEPLRLGIDAQRILTESAPSLATADVQRSLWPHLRSILSGRFAANALRAMRDCGFLDALMPEFKLIDALVIRDFFHRYTVDEHSFLTIDTLHGLKDSASEWASNFAEILHELERPDLLFLSLLLHDVGKGLEGDNHVTSSLSIARDVLQRLGLEQQEQETVRFLIQNHLEMSAAARRDIFDPNVIGVFAAKVGTPELLKMLTLLTYADISSVNPEAMTDWKAETLWHLYVATSNFLNRHVDDDRVHGHLRGESRRRFDSLPPRLIAEIEPFLEGLPQRYLRIYSAEQVAQHFERASHLWQDEVQITLVPYRDLYELTMIATDRPGLFATLAGALSAWGMEIVKANAFSNNKGVVVDGFYFKDRFRTLDLNPSEHDRLKTSIAEILKGQRSLEQLIRARSGFKRLMPARVPVETKVVFDDESSSHHTLVEVIAQDRPGLLYRIARVLAEHDCNIEIALIDTEGEMALDVFYLCAAGHKVPHALQSSIHAAILQRLAAAA
jgi:[protein-PII] uridylyltransferase